MSTTEVRCVHCNKPLHWESPIDTVMVDDTGGDVCGSYGTYGNEPHVPNVDGDD